MSKNEYMDSLRKQLKRLPPEDLQKALEYFEEYFAEAGPKKEAQAIEDLGSPEAAAEQIITDMALNNAKEPKPGIKKGFHGVWIGVLALCAAPIALPLLIVVLAVIFTIFVVIFALLAALFIMAVVLTVTAPFTIAAAFTVVLSNPPAFVSCLGIGLTFLGIGLFLIYAAIMVCKLYLQATVRLFGRIIRKGGKKN